MTSAARTQAPGERSDWRTHGACRNEDPELHFPVGTSGPAYEQELQAKQVCHRCSVKPTCLEWALGERIEFGVHGGKTEKERRDMLRRGDRKVAQSNTDRQSKARAFPDRDLEIERLVQAGLRPAQIAMRLGVSERAVRGWLAETKEPAA